MNMREKRYEIFRSKREVFRLGCVFLFLFVMFLIRAVPFSNAQVIDFGTYVPEDDEKYEIILDVQQELDFGQIISGQSSVQISIHDSEAAEVSINAVRYLDVFVTITVEPEYLYLDGEPTDNNARRIPLELEFGYANTEDGLQGTRQLFSGTTTARFPVRQRPGGPPRPPPTPPHSGYEPPRATAYIVIGGILGSGGEIPSGLDAGNYSATIELEVSYD